MSSTASAWLGDLSPQPVTTWAAPTSARLEAPGHGARPAVNESAVAGLVGRNLRRLRREHRLSLEELARQSGVSRAMLGQVEQGKSIPSIKTLWQVAQVFGVSVSWFIEAGGEAQVLRLTPPAESPGALRAGEGELRSLQQVGDSARDAFYELRLGPGAILSLPAASCRRRINVAVANGTLLAEVDDTAHVVRAREVLQYETHEAPLWRNAGHVEAQAFVIVRPVWRLD